MIASAQELDDAIPELGPGSRIMVASEKLVTRLRNRLGRIRPELRVRARRSSVGSSMQIVVLDRTPVHLSEPLTVTPRFTADELDAIQALARTADVTLNRALNLLAIIGLRQLQRSSNNPGKALAEFDREVALER